MNGPSAGDEPSEPRDATDERSPKAASAAATGHSAGGRWPREVPELDTLFLETIGTAEGRRDPYSRYAELREKAPVYVSSLGFVVCTRYAECQAVLRDPRLGKNADGRDEQLRARFGHLDAYPRAKEAVSDRRSLLFLNPPDHTRLRRLVSKAFTPRTVERLRPEICSLVDGLLDELPAGEAVDVMEALAFPLPVAVIGRMLGVPRRDWTRFRSVMASATLLLEPVMDDAEVEKALLAQLELWEYFSDLVAVRRRRPGSDILSELIAVEEGSDRLSEVELVSTAILLFGAGFETTTNLIGNGLLALLRHPEQLERLRKDRESEPVPGASTARAVEELLRYDSPVQFDGRSAFEDIDISGVKAPAGSEVITILGAANRDPEHWRAPDKLDLRRDEGPPLSFAGGIHYCLGAALARAEGQVVFGRLLDRFSSMELATDLPEFRNRITLRGLEALPVAFEP